MGYKSQYIGADLNCATVIVSPILFQATVAQDVTLTVTSSDTISSVTWTDGAGGAPTAATGPTGDDYTITGQTYTTPGTYKAIIEVALAGGSPATITKEVLITVE